MSAPARQVRARRAQQPAPRRARTTPIPRTPLRPVPIPIPTPRKRSPEAARRRASARFWLIAGVLLSAMVFALTGTYALIAQGAFQMDELVSQRDELIRSNETLQLQVERRSTSEEIARWAQRHQMVLPERIEIISVRPERPQRASDQGIAATEPVTNGPSRDLTGGAV